MSVALTTHPPQPIMGKAILHDSPVCLLGMLETALAFPSTFVLIERIKQDRPFQ